MEDAEAVSEAEVEQRGERFPFARQEPGRVRWPGDIDSFGATLKSPASNSLPAAANWRAAQSRRALK